MTDEETKRMADLTRAGLPTFAKQGRVMLR
jgi:hypothetical protein